MEGADKNAIFHFDARVLRNKPERDPNTGFVRFDCTLGVSGVLTYRSAVGARKELRTDEANQQLEAYIKLMAFPLSMTVEHPPEMINAKNYSTYNKGDIDKQNVRFDSPELIAPVIVCDEDAIRQVLGNKQYSSLGYLCNVINEPGTYRGESYDCIQTKIIPNHVCCTASPRAGDLSRFHFRMDSLGEDNLQVWERCDDDYPTKAKRYFIMNGTNSVPGQSNASFPQQPAPQPMLTYTHGNVSYRVPPELIPVLERQDSLIQRLANDKQDLTSELGQWQSRYDSSVKECKVLEESNDELQGTLDAYLEDQRNHKFRMDSVDEDPEDCEDDYEARVDSLNDVDSIIAFGKRFDGFKEALQTFYPEYVDDAMRLVYGIGYNRTDAADLPMETIGEGYNQLLEDYEAYLEEEIQELRDDFKYNTRTDSVADIVGMVRDVEYRSPDLKEVFEQYPPNSIDEVKRVELAYFLGDGERADSLSPNEVDTIHSMFVKDKQGQLSGQRTDSDEQGTGSRDLDFLLNNRVANPSVNDLLGRGGRYASVVTSREKDRASAYLPK